MSEQVVIDPLKFAHAGASLDDAIDLAKFDRLHDLLRADEGAVRYSLRGVINSEGKPALELDLAGSLTLECQRCLSDLSFPLQLHEELIVAESEGEMDRITAEHDGRECILSNGRLSVLELVEDEILLGLPMCAKHSDCSYPGRVRNL